MLKLRCTFKEGDLMNRLTHNKIYEVKQDSAYWQYIIDDEGRMMYVIVDCVVGRPYWQADGKWTESSFEEVESC